MGDVLGTAVSGLLSYQRAISTTSHNIANVNTDGYSRQRTELDTRFPTAFGSSFIGNGVELTTIVRSHDQFLTNSVRESTSDFTRLEKFSDLASQIDNLLADPEGGISPILQEFFGAVQDMADDPSSGSARYQLLSISEAMVNRFSSFDTRLQQLSSNTEKDIQTSIDEINELAASIANINNVLADTNGSGVLSQQSSDLLDQRDNLLEQLASKVNIQVINEPSNNITVLIGNGQTMVSGSSSYSLHAQPDPADPSKSIIAYTGLISDIDISGQLNGGELGGLLDYRSTVLNPTKNSLGRIAIGLADTFNDQHREGMDLNNALGGDFFSFSQPRTVAHTANTGITASTNVTTTITDVNQLTIDDYTLSFNAGNWQLVSSSGSASTAADVTADLPDAGDTTIAFEGLTIVVEAAAGLPANGDSFSIKPTESGSRTIGVSITDPNAIAAAAPIRTQSSLQNLGDMEISQGMVIDVSNPNLLQTATITFNTPPDTFDVEVGGVIVAAAVPYSNNMAYSLNGWEVNLTGVNPQPGDTLTIEANLGGVGDNRNALELSRLQTTGFFDNGSNNYQEAYSVLVGRVGSLTHSAEVDRDAQGALLSQAEDRRSQVSGVNLDEEAANLIKYQQAYEASARVISTIQTLFETLINSTR
ncbi:MAG: flagellar hook-associated protein FlgK [Gammaproteobacteria bacterium]|nr:flagellar hook-associated protein FlgK [Gammaproteobacteria bacterium]